MTNNDLQAAFNTKIETAFSGYQIAFPGVKLTPPDAGKWLEVEFFPNQPIDNGLSYTDGVIDRGFFQVLVCDRPGKGMISLGMLADEVIEEFPKGTTLSTARTTLKPYQMQPIYLDDRTMIPITIPYSQ